MEAEETSVTIILGFVVLYQLSLFTLSTLSTALCLCNLKCKDVADMGTLLLLLCCFYFRVLDFFRGIFHHAGITA